MLAMHLKVMPLRCLLFAVMLCVGCKSDKPAATSTPAGSATGSGSAAAIDAAVRPPTEDLPPPREPIPPTPEAIHALHKEPIGGVTLGMTEQDVVKALGTPKHKTKAALIGNAKGEYGVTWTWPGIKATLGSASTSGPFTLREITFSPPSKAKTARGIGIGSTRAEVAKAYAGLLEPAVIEDPRFLVAGALGSGLNGIELHFDKPGRTDEFGPKDDTDKVTSIEAAGGAWD